MAPQPERLASLEATVSIAKWVLGIFIPLVIVWGSFITVNVIAIKQQLADGGNTKLVAELKAPKSAEQLQANLSTAIAQIQTARVQRKQPSVGKLDALSTAITDVAKREPKLPQVWQAESELISYRSETLSPNSPKVLSTSAGKPCKFELFATQPGSRYSNCEVTLEDVAEMTNGIKIGDQPSNLQFTDCIVHYYGGPLPTTQMTFYNSVFRFDVPIVPSSRGSNLILAIAEAKDLTLIQLPKQATAQS